MSNFTKDDIADCRKWIKDLTDDLVAAENVLCADEFAGLLDDALDEIELLTARIAELEAAQRWIPVSERLPEETGLYLVWQDGSFAVGYRVLYYSAGRSYLDFMWAIATHWMPLPQPPEVQE